MEHSTQKQQSYWLRVFDLHSLQGKQTDLTEGTKRQGRPRTRLCIAQDPAASLAGDRDERREPQSRSQYCDIE